MANPRYPWEQKTVPGTYNSTTGNLGNLADFGSYRPPSNMGEDEQGAITEQGLARDVFVEGNTIAELNRRQQRSDILGTTDQWRDSTAERSAQTRGYLGDYQKAMDARQAQYGTDLSGANAAYDAKLKDVYDPYRQQGLAADAEANALAGSAIDVDMEADPGVQYRTREAQKALERQRSATGTRNSGAAQIEMARQMQDRASQEYGNAYGRARDMRTERLNMLSSLSGRGSQFAGQYGTQMTDPATAVQNTQGNAQNLAGTTADYGQIYSNRLGALTGTSQNYSDSLGQNLEGMGANQAQIIANKRAADEARRAARAGTFNSVLNAGATAAAVYASSDPRLKDNIKLIGRMENGLPWYEFTYKGSDEVVQGTMSTHVRKFMPEAVVVQNGYDTVNYSMLTGEL